MRKKPINLHQKRYSMKKLLVMAMLSCTIAAQAQEVNPTSKFTIELQEHLGLNIRHPKALTRGEEAPKIKVLVTLVPAAGITAADLEAVGCEVKWAMKSVASVIVSVDQLEALAAIPGVRNIDLPQKLELHNNISRGVVHVDEVVDPKTAVAAGLPHEYDGTGVLVGLVDNGIDFRHYAYTDEAGNIRFKKTWTQRYDKDASDYIITAHDTPDEILSVNPLTSGKHGSHVLGIMTGRDLGNHLQGMAPKAGIVAVDIDRNYTDQVIEGMKYLCEYAEDNGIPIAINLSTGLEGVWADGCHPMSQAMIELNDNGTKPGVIFSVSAGNEGDKTYYVSHKFTSDDDKLFVICEADKEAPDFEGHKLILPHGQEKIKVWTNRLLEQKEEMLAVFDLDKKTMIEDPDTEIGVARVTHTVENGDTKYQIETSGISTEFKIITLRFLREQLKEADWFSSSIHTCADGKTQKDEMLYTFRYGNAVRLFENLRIGICFSYPAGTEIRVANQANGNFIKPEGFDCAKASTANGTINTVACNAACIATGSYTIRDAIINVFGYKEAIKNNVVNDVTLLSSYGITFNEEHLPKPEVLAPGSFVQSTTNNSFSQYFPKIYGVLSDKIDFEKEPDVAGRLSSRANVNGQDYWYDYQEGTSMAAPVTTGIIALWLQANPKLSTADVREILRHSSTRFTSPNYEELKSSAFGIINALEGLKYINANMTSISNVSDSQQHDDALPAYNLFGQPTKGQGFVVKNGRVVFVK